MKKKEFIVLGIHDGHNASACLLSDGRIVAAVSEERLSRLKNDFGYPMRAVEKALEMNGLNGADIDRVALGTRFMHSAEFFQDWNWYRKGYSQQLDDMDNARAKHNYFLNERLPQRRAVIAQHIGISQDKITIVEHHDAHAATAYYSSPWANSNNKVLVLTLDGSGDGLCATVNIGEKGRLKRIAETKSDASFGKVYSRLTFLLGMKPWEHEYKIMGLAPYAEQKGVEKSYRIIRPLVEVDDGNLVFRKGTHIWPGYCYPYLKSELENHRFDWIAGAAQKVAEELLVKWVNNAVKKTGIGKIACSGGVFMNVKANLLLTELRGIRDIFVVPSCGDESICIGAAYEVYAGHMRGNKKKFEIHPFDSIYLGPEFSQDDIRPSLDALGAGKKYNVRFSADINRIAARLLAAGEIVARFDGRMEWGARALGNRSILMNPKNTAKLTNLNAAIKCRDFWMPFAPTVLYEKQLRYISNPKNIKSPHMMLGFRSTEKAKTEFAAAMHPYDGTIRPQILERKDNPGYYDLIKHFESISGIGGLLNTSFNIHGEPIVCAPEDAISTFRRSGLEFMIMGNCLVSKKRRKKA